ncbi:MULTISPECIES: helix-turn-helix transcriptional regulator [Burkholderia cepacia complex]|uniref:helix-turn-helix transcriptional regulator n=1 Tax=Burkholderia cepacia complex TaxID=87882 RepID=UPI00075F04CB|nr:MULTISPECIES: helix-turn-helix domain-containing protein [Burkholderia cepacia complex]KVS62778.1 hypothetical protein WK41_32380 [Burkholderia cepacia]QTO47444.1 helix-turn-helix domain-containing protein [Burkholderia latens]
MNDLVNRIAEGKAQLLGIDDICQRLGVSRTTFDRWVRNGGGKTGSTTLADLVGSSIAGRGMADAAANLTDGATSFPPPDIYIGKSPKWEMQTFKTWLRANVTEGK